MASLRRARRPRPRATDEEDQPDLLELERITDLGKSAAWSMVRARLARIREQKINDLIQPTHSETETATLRGFLAGLETAERVPGILISELKGKLPHGQKP